MHKHVPNEPQVEITEVTDPDELEKIRLTDEQMRRNTAWLSSHWEEVLPGARGRFLAVAGQEAFVADTAQQAAALARAAHPDDLGMLVRYVRLDRGPKIYANRG